MSSIQGFRLFKEGKAPEKLFLILYHDYEKKRRGLSIHTL